MTTESSEHMPSTASAFSTATQAATAATRMSSQPITTELRQWILAQAEAGFTAPVVLKSMCDAGWQEEVALAALETTLREHLEARTLQGSMPPAVPVPAPPLEDSPLYVDVGDRRVHVLQSLALPRVVVFGNLLSDEECDALVALARPRMARSLTIETQTGGEEVNSARTSTGMFFTRGECDVVQRLEARIAQLTRWPLENGEGLQVLNYQPGAEYKPHHDYFDPHEAGTPTILRRGGQRVATVLVYLNEPERGGGTTFPDVGLEVAPKRGNAVFFSYDRPHPATRSLHGGAPVIAGEKWIATKWLREREFT